MMKLAQKVEKVEKTVVFSWPLEADYKQFITHLNRNKARLYVFATKNSFGLHSLFPPTHEINMKNDFLSFVFCLPGVAQSLVTLVNND